MIFLFMFLGLIITCLTTITAIVAYQPQRKSKYCPRCGQDARKYVKYMFNPDTGQRMIDYIQYSCPNDSWVEYDSCNCYG